MKCGNYSLWDSEDISINICVHKGVIWEENRDYIFKDKSLFECGAKQDYIRFRNVSLEEKEGKKYAKLQIDGCTNDQWRVHAFLFRYLPKDLSNLTEKLLEKSKDINCEHKLNFWKNFYLSNKQLSSETRYCFDRRSYKKFMGNTLDKPKLVLRREYFQKTTTRDERLDEGNDYDTVEKEELLEEQDNIEKTMKRKRGEKRKVIQKKQN